MAARSIATATISFGLVSIPVKLYPSTRTQNTISFHQLDPEGARVKQQLVSSRTGEVVERAELRKGYEFAKGRYVVFTPEELKALEAQSTGAVEIREFVPISAVDPVYYEKAYYLGPDKGGARSYQLLAKAMRDSGYVGIGKYAARGKDYLAMIRPADRGLILQQLFYADELRAFDEVPIDEAEVKPAELKLARQLIDQVASDTFDPTQYEDTVRARILELIEKKVAGEEIAVEPEEVGGAQVIDLMEALKKSLSGEKKPAKRAAKPAAKSAKGKSASPKKGGKRKSA